MKKRLFALTTSVLLALSFVGCGGSAAEEPAPAPDLTGEWAQVNSNSEDMYHIATIEGETIEIYWFSPSDETKALYWAGDFVAPETADEPYTWTSTNDTEKTGSALLASGDETKEFTYEAGQISYEAGMMGVSMTVKLEKQSDIAPTEKTEKAKPAETASAGDLGDCTFSINNYVLAEDYEGNPAIIVDFDFTNNGEEATSFMVASMAKAFQDGIELETAVIMDESVYNIDNYMKDIKPGATLNVQQAWALDSETSPVEIELEEFVSFSGEKLVKTFEITE